MEQTDERRRRQALQLAARASRKHTEAERARRNAMWFAHETGASLRDIAEATGVPHVTVKRIIDRQPATPEAAGESAALPLAEPIDPPARGS